MPQIAGSATFEIVAERHIEDAVRASTLCANWAVIDCRLGAIPVGPASDAIDPDRATLRPVDPAIDIPTGRLAHTGIVAIWDA
jgi:hypothetical protein